MAVDLSDKNIITQDYKMEEHDEIIAKYYR